MVAMIAATATLVSHAAYGHVRCTTMKLTTYIGYARCPLQPHMPRLRNDSRAVGLRWQRLMLQKLCLLQIPCIDSHPELPLAHLLSFAGLAIPGIIPGQLLNGVAHVHQLRLHGCDPLGPR